MAGFFLQDTSVRSLDTLIDKDGEGVEAYDK